MRGLVTSDAASWPEPMTVSRHNFQGIIVRAKDGLSPHPSPPGQSKVLVFRSTMFWSMVSALISGDWSARVMAEFSVALAVGLCIAKLGMAGVRAFLR